MQARLAARGLAQARPPITLAQAREYTLHKQILEECRSRGWLVIHSRLDLPATVAVGTPDFVIIADCGRTFLVEAKARGGKPTTAQLAWLAMAAKLDHEAALVRSFEEFLRFVEGK